MSCLLIFEFTYMKMSLELSNFIAIMSIEKKTPHEIMEHMKG